MLQFSTYFPSDFCIVTVARNLWLRSYRNTPHKNITNNFILWVEEKLGWPAPESPEVSLKSKYFIKWKVNYYQKLEKN